MHTGKNLLLLLSFVSAMACKAQTADEIITRHINALGGKEKLKSLRSVHLAFALQEQGAETPGDLTILYNKGYKIELMVVGIKIIECYTDKEGWVLNSLWYTGLTKLTDNENLLQKDKIDAGGALLDYKQKGSTVLLQAKEENNFRILLTTKEGTEIEYLIDPATYYIMKETRYVKKAGVLNVISTVQFAGYKKSPEGYVYPSAFYASGSSGPPLLPFVVKNVSVNQPVDTKIFAMGDGAN